MQKKYIIITLCLFLMQWNAVAAVGYNSHQKGDFLLVSTPYGQRMYVGEMGFKELNDFKVEIKIDDIRKGLMPAPFKETNAFESKAEKSPSTLENDDLITLRANQLFNDGKFNEALSFVEELLRRNNKNARAWLMKGSLMYAMGEKDLAGKSWEKAFELDPKNIKILNVLESLKQ